MPKNFFGEPKIDPTFGWSQGRIRRPDDDGQALPVSEEPFERQYDPYEVADNVYSIHYAPQIPAAVNYEIRRTPEEILAAHEAEFVDIEAIDTMIDVLKEREDEPIEHLLDIAVEMQKYLTNLHHEGRGFVGNTPMERDAVRDAVIEANPAAEAWEIQNLIEAVLDYIDAFKKSRDQDAEVQAAVAEIKAKYTDLEDDEIESITAELYALKSIKAIEKELAGHALRS